MMESRISAICIILINCIDLARLNASNEANPSLAEGGVQLASDSGASKIGGSHIHKTLPPCKIEGREIVHSNTSCIFTPTSSDKQRHKDGTVKMGNGHYNMTSSDSSHGGSGRGGAGDMKGQPGYKEQPAPYDKDGKYWLVPPFLIGASSVIVVYIVIHCVYLHCYAKRKMRQMAHRNASPAAFIFSDGDGPSVSSLQTYTPIVTYDGSSYGRTDLRESQPFIVYHAADSPEVPPSEASSERRPSKRKKSMHLQLPELFRNRGRPRPSVCSASATMETPTSSTGEAIPPDGKVRRATRASICYVPVSRTISDPTGGAQNPQTVEWTQLQGFVYPSVVLPSNASFSIPSGSFSSISRDEVPSSPFILIQNPAAAGEPATEASGQRRESETTRPASSRKTSFRDPEAETVTIPLTSYPEDDKEDK